MSKEDSNTNMSNKEIDLNILTKFISKFDGNREQLNAFLNNCRNAIALASTFQQNILLKYIISQLEGRAESACSIKEFESWAQLEEFLKSQFGDKRHYAALLSDLQECRQSNSETVNQFALRIESCLSKLLSEISISMPLKKKTELVGRVAAMQDLALHTFVVGLNPKLSTVVRCRDPETLNDAISFATSEEKILASQRRSYPLPNNHYNQTTTRTSQRQSPAYVSRNFIQHDFNGARNARPLPSAPPLICRYCKTQGHTIEVCQKREFNNNRYRIPQSPQFKGRPYQEYNKPGPSRINNIEITYNDSEPQHTGISDPETYNRENHLNE